MDLNMKKIIGVLSLLILQDNAHAKIANLEALLECSTKGSRVEDILKAEDAFAQKIAQTINIFHQLETFLNLESEQRNILESLIKLDKVLFHTSESLEDQMSLDLILAYLSTMNHCIDQLMLKIINVPSLDHDPYNAFFIELKNMLNGIEVPLRDLIENHSKKCSTRFVLEAAGRFFIEDEKLDSSGTKDPLEGSFLSRTFKNMRRNS
jgi:hypothetical protein